MWKLLFVFLVVFGSCKSEEFARAAGSDNNPSRYGSYRTDSIAASDSIRSSYGSEGTDAIAASDSIPTTYGSEGTDAVAVAPISRSFEINWPRVDFCPGEDGNRFANENARIANQGPQPALPTNKELAGFTNEQLSSFIASVSQGYIRELDQFNTGDTWVKYFYLNELQSAAPQPLTEFMYTTQPSKATTIQSQNFVNDILARMDFVSKNNEYQTVTDTWRFKALHSALQEASRSPEERTASVLLGQAEKLNKALDQLSTGEGWRNHLEINAIEQLSRQKNVSTDENLAKIATKFDRVARNPAYQSIVQLPGFQGVNSTLHDLTEGRQTQFSAKREPPSSENKIRK